MVFPRTNLNLIFNSKLRIGCDTFKLSKLDKFDHVAGFVIGFIFSKKDKNKA